MVQNLYSDGHEFASHTVSHPAENELRNFNSYNWTKEIIGMFKMVSSTFFNLSVFWSYIDFINDDINQFCDQKYV